ncbi:hypothetical protein F66182_4182 [Fusarium sp. NRRL 66182]|nr:hypothetical protein F66182_4182 [Fusarium sp. NRRL 66182]
MSFTPLDVAYLGITHTPPPVLCIYFYLSALDRHPTGACLFSRLGTEPDIGVMNGSGFGDSDKLAAAKELARFFGSEPKPGKKAGGKGRGRVTSNGFGGNSIPNGTNNGSGSSSIPMKRQESCQHEPRPATAPPSNFHAPRPSQRNYTPTLLPNPFERPAGPVLGKAGLAFLKREDAMPKPAQGTSTQEAAKKITNSTVTQTSGGQDAVSSLQEHAKKVVSVPEEKPHTSPPVVPKHPDVCSNIDLLRGLITDQVQPAAKPSTTTIPQQTPTLTQSSVSPPNVEEKPKNNVASTFFFLMSEDSDEEDEEKSSPTPKADDKPVNKSHSIAFLKYSSDDLLKLMPHAKADVLSPDCIVKRANKTVTKHINGVGNSVIASTVSKAFSHLALSLQETTISSTPRLSEERQLSSKPDAPQAPTTDNFESLESQQAVGDAAASQDVTRGKPEPPRGTENPGLRPQAPGFVPIPRAVSSKPSKAPAEPSQIINPPTASSPVDDSIDQRGAKQVTEDNFVLYTPFMGQLVTIAPVQFANGFLIPGPPSGHAIVQPTAAAFNPFPALGVHPPAQRSTFFTNLPIQSGEPSTTASTTKPKKPTVGLSTSMWAK